MCPLGPQAESRTNTHSLLLTHAHGRLPHSRAPNTPQAYISPLQLWGADTVCLRLSPNWPQPPFAEHLTVPSTGKRPSASACLRLSAECRSHLDPLACSPGPSIRPDSAPLLGKCYTVPHVAPLSFSLCLDQTVPSILPCPNTNAFPPASLLPLTVPGLRDEHPRPLLYNSGTSLTPAWPPSPPSIMTYQLLSPAPPPSLRG